MFSKPALKKNQITNETKQKSSGGLFRKFRKNEEGITAIEFALVSMPFIAVLFAVIELGFIFFAEMMLNNGMNNAARMIRTGQAQGMSESQFKQIMCNDVFLIKNCPTSVILDVRSFDDFGDINLPPALVNGNVMNNPAFNPGSRKQVVVVRALHAWDLLIPNITNLSNMGSAYKFLLSTSTTFRNEPF